MLALVYLKNFIFSFVPFSAPWVIAIYVGNKLVQKHKQRYSK